MRLIPKPTTNTVEWLLSRQRDEHGKTIVGGSDAPALMGDSPYKTRADLYIDKIEEPTTPVFNPVFHRGNVLEPVLVGEASRVLKQAFVTPEVMYRSGRWNINSDAVDNPTAPTVNIECKTTTRYSINSPADLPIEWRWQGWAQMLVLDVPVFFSVLDNRQQLSVVELERDERALELLAVEAELFCDAVDNRRGIDLYLDEMTAQQIAQLVPSTGSTRDLTEHIEVVLELIEDLQSARAVRKEAEEAETRAKDGLARLLAGADVGLVADYPLVTWKQQTGKPSIDMARLRAEHPDLVAKYERAGHPFRVMRVNNRKEA